MYKGIYKIVYLIYIVACFNLGDQLPSSSDICSITIVVYIKCQYLYVLLILSQTFKNQFFFVRNKINGGF